MKTIALAVVSAMMALSVGADSLKELMASKGLTQNGWPGIRNFRVYKMAWSQYFWNGFGLASTKTPNGVSLVDANRDKVRVNGKVLLDTFGLVDYHILEDFRTNYRITHIPFTGECTRGYIYPPPPPITDLDVILNGLYQPGGWTTYDEV